MEKEHLLQASQVEVLLTDKRQSASLCGIMPEDMRHRFYWRPTPQLQNYSKNDYTTER